MKTRDLAKLGVPRGPTMGIAIDAAVQAVRSGIDRRDVFAQIRSLIDDPMPHRDDPHFGRLASEIERIGDALARYQERQEPAPYRQWGTDLEESSVKQIQNACKLPVAVKGALMADAHLGYGLPIGGVLGTDNAVIPYAVGVDIACRVKMTVLDIPVTELDDTRGRTRLTQAIEAETRFGIGAHFKKKRQHEVMDEDWSVSGVAQHNKDRAWKQLGSSGSGNHFVEFGDVVIDDARAGLEPGKYLALLSHSGSRGVGAAIAKHYSTIAMREHPELPGDLRHLAWLDLDSEAGNEYWEAMELMGRYAAANHELIHHHIARNLRVDVMLDLENHHNFAWKEIHDGKELVVHRKGATPAGVGDLGIIPGSMATPTYVAIGLGNEDSLRSASHGAGRVMSRTRAKKELSWSDAQKKLDREGIDLISAGLDEAPMVYKDIDQVMAAQADLVQPLARFMPRIVKMAPSGEPPED